MAILAQRDAMGENAAHRAILHTRIRAVLRARQKRRMPRKPRDKVVAWISFMSREHLSRRVERGCRRVVVWLSLALITITVIAVIAVTIYSTRRRNKCTCGRGKNAIRFEVEDKNPKHYPYELTFYIGDMKCSKCPILLENALNSIDGVWAQVNLNDEKALVRMKQPVKKTVFQKTVKDAGFRILKMTSQR